MKTIEEQIEVMQHFANGGEVECLVDGKWGIFEPTWDWCNKDYRIKEHKYPMWFKYIGINIDNEGLIVKFTSLDVGEVVKPSIAHKDIGAKELWEEHTNKKIWQQVEEPKKTITIEKWLYKEQSGLYSVLEVSPSMAKGNGSYIKLLETYEIEI